jgi:hypothetical protein
VLDGATRTWWTGVAWTGTEALALPFPLTEKVITDPDYNRYADALTLPDGAYTLEYVYTVTGEVIGEEVYYGTAGASLADIEGSTVLAKEATLLGMGTLPSISHVFTIGEKIVVARGDTINVPFALGPLHDCTGKHLWFAVKYYLSDAAALFEVECVLSNEANVVGYVPLTATELALAMSGIYEFERVDDVNDSNPHTITQGKFVIVQDVRH